MYAPIFDLAGVRDSIRQSPHRFYVYVLCRPNGEPFYVGKGVANRVFCHEADARNLPTKSHKLNLIRALHKKGLKVGYVIEGFFETEIEAHERERTLILTLGRHDLRTGPLTNQTDGGEGTSNPSQESRDRRAATLGGDAEDPERRAINEFFNSIGGKQDSVPIKPLGARKLVPLTPHPSSRMPTERMAKALIAAAAATNQILKPGSILPRIFVMQGKPYAIENGVGRDMLKAGMISLMSPEARPEDECLCLTTIGFDQILHLMDVERLKDLAVLEPD